MGCDIHGYIEWQKGDEWRAVHSEPHIERNYAFFGIIAGVRAYSLKMFEPRGLPENCSVMWEFTLGVTSDEWKLDTDGYTTPELAARWVQDGSSVKWGDNRITNPDWHTPSWLNADELEAAIAKYDTLPFAEPGDIDDVRAVLGAMRALDIHGNSKFIFWFDN